MMSSTQISCLLALRLRLSVVHTTMTRYLHTTAGLENNVRSGVPKITSNRSKPLSYEQSQKPYRIGITKYWNSINTSGLYIDKEYEKWLPRSSETTIEDEYIRKFINGTFQSVTLGETIIKRRGNLIVVTLLVRNLIFNKRSVYFMKGFTETLLPRILKCPVKVELQTVDDARSLVFKKI